MIILIDKSGYYVQGCWCCFSISYWVLSSFLLKKQRNKSFLIISMKRRKKESRHRNQIDDPTFKICKELQRIIHPLTIKAKSYIKDLYHFKQRLKEIKIEDHFIQLSFDVRSLFPSVPLSQTLAWIQGKLQRDRSLKDRTILNWKPN